jgi:hypothetical protein
MAVNVHSDEDAAYRLYVAAHPLLETGRKQLEETSPGMTNLIVGPARDFYYEIQSRVSTMLKNNLSPEITAVEMTKALNLLLEDYASANE